MKVKKILGIDVGGSGIKGAIVNTKTGKFKTRRYRIPTPEGATPDDVAAVVGKIATHFKWTGPIGCGFPAVVRNGIAQTAANVDKSWIGTNIAEKFEESSGCPVVVLNDADAAGMAEMKFGSGKGKKGVVMLFTVGTGIGTVIFSHGKLVPNTELGHVLLNTMSAEEYASDAVRQNEQLSWEEWAGRFNEYLLYMERLFWPDLMIIGGGMSKKDEKFNDQLTVKTTVIPAKLRNDAGIIGAAVAARLELKSRNKH